MSPGSAHSIRRTAEDSTYSPARATHAANIYNRASFSAEGGWFFSHLQNQVSHSNTRSVQSRQGENSLFACQSELGEAVVSARLIDIVRETCDGSPPLQGLGTCRVCLTAVNARQEKNRQGKFSDQRLARQFLGEILADSYVLVALAVTVNTPR